MLSEANMANDKKETQPMSSSPPQSIRAGDVEHIKAEDDDFEVFKRTTDGVQFRLVGWVRASVIFLKSKFGRHSM